MHRHLILTVKKIIRSINKKNKSEYRTGSHKRFYFGDHEEYPAGASKDSGYDQTMNRFFLGETLIIPAGIGDAL